MAKLSAIKTLADFDFAFQPSLDKNRVMVFKPSNVLKAKIDGRESSAKD